MKLKLFLRLLIAVCLSAIIVFAFSACKEKQVYADKDDFESYPEEYWNGYNNNSSENIYGSGNIIIDGNSSSGDGTGSDDPNANFTEDDEENSDNPFKEPDNDNDGIPDNADPDDDNDDIPDDEDDDSNGNGTPDDEEKTITNSGPLVMF